DFVLQQLRLGFAEDPARLKARGDSLLEAFPDDAVLNVALADVDGNVTYRSGALDGSINVSDRDYFVAHRAGGAELRIGVPLAGRASSTLELPFTRAVQNGGRFAGVAVVTLSPQGVSQILGRLELASEDVISLVNKQGVVLAHNRTPGAVGRTVSPARPFMLAGAAPTGIYRTAGFNDGKERIFAWRQVGGTDLFAVVGLDLNTVLLPLAQRHQREWRYALTLSGMLLLLGTGMLYLLARLARGQRAVALSAAKLRQLIDGLGPDMFVGLLTPEGTLVEVNRPALDLAGLSPTDVIGKPCEQTYWFAHSAAAQADMRSAIERAAQGTASRFDLQIGARQDRLTWIDFSLQPLRDDNGTIIYL
ncbi:MAG: PAS domain-containing protein, partial [Rubrivivax sp.]|nr:PAS domain-containing protein [Rubrivivax sp.]